MDKLSVEHCIPSSVGGTLATCTLTCKACNNRFGSKYESHLRRKIDEEEFSSGQTDTKLRGYVSVAEKGMVRADFIHTKRDGKSSFDVRIDEKRSHIDPLNATIQLMKDHPSEPPDGCKVQFNLEFRYNPQKVMVALLRIGYLMMFRQYGYGYILDKSNHRVKLQLKNPDQKVIPVVKWMDLPDHEEMKNNMVMILKHPKQFQCFVVAARLKRKDGWITKGIAMPGFESWSDSVYERFIEQAKSDKMVTSTFSIQTYDPDLIGDSERVPEPLIDWKRNTEWKENSNTG